MKVLVSWLRDFVDVTASAEEIARTISVRGFAVEGLETVGDHDAVIDFEVTGNRPDCMDTGPRVQGRLLDLYMWSCHEALAFGRKRIQVTVLRLGWNPQASTPGVIDRLFRRREQAKIDIPDVAPPPVAVEAPADVSSKANGGQEPTSTSAPAPLRDSPTFSGPVESVAAPKPLP